MNPFSRKCTITSPHCSVTNIRSLATLVAGATRAKITRIVDLNCDLNILIDTRTSVEDVEKIFLNHKLKWKLSQFKHIKTYAKNPTFSGDEIQSPKNLKLKTDRKIKSSFVVTTFFYKTVNSILKYDSSE